MFDRAHAAKQLAVLSAATISSLYSLNNPDARTLA